MWVPYLCGIHNMTKRIGAPKNGGESWRCVLDGKKERIWEAKCWVKV